MRNASTPILILFATLVIVMLGFGIVVPILPFYVAHFGASGRALGILMAIYSLMQFLFAPLWGRLSDRIGRKPVLLIGLAGFAVSFVLQGFSRSLIQLIAARAGAGILSSATLPTALAFIADTTPPDNRSQGMGMMGAAMGLGMIFGPMIAGPLTALTSGPFSASWMQIALDAEAGRPYNLSLPFFAAALLAFVTLPLVVGLLPESLPPAERGTPHAARVSRWMELRGAILGPLAFLFIAAFLLAFALANLESVLGLFGKDRFGMGPTAIGMIMALIGLLSVIQQGVVIGPLTRRIGETRVLRWGLAVSVIGLAGIAVARLPWQMILMAVVFNAGNSLLRPSVASLISQRAGTGQGVAMGLENSFMSLGRVAGPLWAGFSYEASLTAPFWTAAFIQLLALAISFRWMEAPVAAADPAVAA